MSGELCLGCVIFADQKQQEYVFPTKNKNVGVAF